MLRLFFRWRDFDAIYAREEWPALRARAEDAEDATPPHAYGPARLISDSLMPLIADTARLRLADDGGDIYRSRSAQACCRHPPEPPHASTAHDMKRHRID